MPEPSTADRRRARQREHLIDTALELFEAHGFDNVSVDQVAEAGDISPRTFFRYFDTKAAVVTGVLAEHMGMIGDLVVARPAEEPIDVAIREAAIEQLSRVGSSARFRRALRLMVGSTALRSGMVTGTPLEAVLTDAVGRRHPEFSPVEATTAAAIGTALLRQPVALLGFQADLDESVRTIREVFATSKRVWQ